MKNKMNPFSYFWLGTFIVTALVATTTQGSERSYRERGVRAHAVSTERPLERASYRAKGWTQPNQPILKAAWPIKKAGPWWPIWGGDIAREAGGERFNQRVDYRYGWGVHDVKAGNEARFKATAVDLSRPNLKDRTSVNVRLRADVRLDRELKVVRVTRDRNLERANVRSIRLDRHSGLLAGLTLRERERIIESVDGKSAELDALDSREQLDGNPAEKELRRAVARV